MKKHLALLAVFVLVGGGCRSNDEISPELMPVIYDLAGVGVDLGISPVVESVAVGGDSDIGPVTASAPKTIQMKSGNFFFDPSIITAEPGQEITIHFTENAGFHTIVIDSINLVKKVEADGTVIFTAPIEPGDYEFYCNIGSHLAMGMKGTLTVK